MDVLKAIQKNVPERIFQRGNNYYREGRIKEYTYTELEDGEFDISARVRGSTIYKVDIFLQLENSRLYIAGNCSCPYDRGDLCKHEVAVLRKFVLEDLPDHQEIQNTYHFNKLLQVSNKLQHDTRHILKYYVKGLLIDNMVNFKVTLKSPTLSQQHIKEIIAYISGDDYSYLPDQGSFDQQDLNVLHYFHNIYTRRSRSDGAFLFKKNSMNFNYLLRIISEREVYLEETGEKAVVGDPLYPELVIKGDIEEVYIEKKRNYPLYEAANLESKLYWSVIGNTVHPVEEEVIEELPEVISVPLERRGELLFEVIPTLDKRFPVKIDDKLKKHELVKKEPGISLKLDYRDDAVFCKCYVDMDGEQHVNSDILKLDTDNREYERDTEDPYRWYTWDLELIKELIDFLDYNNFHVNPDGFVIRNGGDIQEFITDGFLHMPEEWEIETTEDFDQVEIIPVELNPVIEFKETEDDGRINWFEFSVTFNLGGRSYSYNELKKLLRYNKQGEGYLKIGNSYYVLRHGQQQEKLDSALKLAEENEDNTYRSNYYNILYYRNLIKEAGINFKGNRVINQLEEDITKKRLVEEVEIPEEVKDIMRNYQKEGYYWFTFLDKYGFGGILADDMGLGKTLQALTFLKSIKKKVPALVICPRSLIYNWGEEIEKYFPGTDYLVYYGSPEERSEMRDNFSHYEVIITSYSIISRDYKELKKQHFSYCILDEAQHIKNHRTKRAKGVKQIKSGGRLALTGTPIENSLTELWSIMDFLMPGYLGKYNRFRREYVSGQTETDQQKIEEIKKRVAPFILRRKKEDVLKELPEKMVNVQKVDMTRLQEDTYRYVLEEVKTNLMETVARKGFNKSRINVLAALTRLRQICNHPSLVFNEIEPGQSSGKMEALIELVEEALEGGHKIIVFSQFVQMLKLIRQKFEKMDISYEYLDGSTRNRMERVKRFNENKDVKTFLISLKAGGLGLNLTGADMVIHVDPWWNPMVERQATDRAHRLGQKERVIVYKLITAGTVEEKMLKLQERKRKLFDNVIERSKSAIEDITWEDIQELLEYR